MHVHLRARGFTLVELMVGLLISLLCTLAMFKAFAGFEGQKRTTTSGNDAQQNGSYSLFQLERQIRSAGSGLTQGNRYNVWGCAITAYSSSTKRLPLATGATLPSPFASWPGTTRAMPVLIQSGGSGPDTIAVVAGNPAVRTFKTKVSSTPDSSTVAIDSSSDNVTGISPGEYLLASDSSGNDCTLTRAASVNSATNKITLSAADSPATGLTKAFSGQGYLFDLGTAPAFTLFGIDSNRTLVSYDLLQRDSGNTTSMADGIAQIKALYGVDTDGDGVIDSWVLPTGDWALDKLTTDAATAAAAYSKIKAVRVAVVAQSLLPERIPPTGATGPGIDPGYKGSTSLTLFGDLNDLSLHVNVATQEQYRYKVYDTTIPVRGSFINKFY